MGLSAPNLDDRSFQDIVDEARRLIPKYCPKWTDHNLSDPGITLVELFAWMTEMTIFRLNQVPDRHYIKFLDLIGVRLQPPRPARADIIFHLTAPQPQAVPIPEGTEVATHRTETQEAISFTTDRDLEILVPEMVYCLVGRGAGEGQAEGAEGSTFYDYRQALRNPDIDAPIFRNPPQIGDAFYLGYRENLAAHLLRLGFACPIMGHGVVPSDPPLSWEYWDAEGGWQPMRPERDTTGGLNREGEVELLVPYGCTLRPVDGKHACWIRVVYKVRPDQRPYVDSPRINGVATEAIGGMVPASHSQRIVDEMLGRSDGLPGQVFRLQAVPILARRPGETLEVANEDGETFERWVEVQHFGASGPDDPHFTLDDVTGEIRFGPSLRERDGRVRQYGRIPPRGRLLRFTSYRFGGGVVGNVGPKTLTVLKTSIPYVRPETTNREAATGGRDAESLEAGKLRGPQVVRSREVAVTAEDFERLALAASSQLARARCRSVGEAPAAEGTPPGTVTLLLVPALPLPAGPLTAKDVAPSSRLRQEVKDYLDERRLMGVELRLAAPEYRWVSTAVRVKAKKRVDHRQLQRDVEERLYRFVHPVHGGPEGNGWPFGRPLHQGELYGVVQTVEGVEYVEGVQLLVADATGQGPGQPSEVVELPADGLLCSQRHQVSVR